MTTKHGLAKEKALLLAVSGIAGAIAGVRSRCHRIQAASLMEHTLSDAALSVREMEPEPRNRRSTISSFSGLVVHATISCACIWRVTSDSVGMSHYNVLALGFASMALLILHAWFISSQKKRMKKTSLEEEVASSAPSAISADHRHAIERHLPTYVKRCNGRWIKDRDASDSMDPVCDIMGIGGIMKVAIRLIVGSDVAFLSQGSASFQFAAFSVITWFKIRERYPLIDTSLSLAHHRRRDFRPGGMQGRIHLKHDAHTNSPVVTIDNTFYGHRAGTMKEVFTWPQEDVMHVDTVISNDHGTASFAQVFHKKTN